MTMVRQNIYSRWVRLIILYLHVDIVTLQKSTCPSAYLCVSVMCCSDVTVKWHKLPLLGRVTRVSDRSITYRA